jgi:selenocysteine lyase/cysteine desulfurase
MSPPLDCQKASFSIPPGEVYLNSAYMGPLPLQTQQAGHAALVRRAFPGNITASDFFEPAERVRALCAQLVHADPEHVALVPTVSAALAIISANLQPHAGQNVVLLAEQFPSNVHPWRRWRAAGVELRSVEAPSDAQGSLDRAGRMRGWNQRLLEAIDAQTALVTVEPAHWTDGTLFDLAAIGVRCREVGACFVVDGTQTVGVMPCDVRAIGCDLLAVHSYKAMLSNYGLGFAVLSDRFSEARPIEESWLMRAGSEDFARLVDYRDEYASGMRRFDTSLRGNPVLIAMLEASCRLLLAWQPARIRDYLTEIEREFVDEVRALGFGVANVNERAANLFGLVLPPGLDALSVRAELAERHIHVSVRGPAIRVSPHVYNDAADLDRLSSALRELVRTH